MKKGTLWMIFLGLFLFGLDLWTKSWADEHLLNISHGPERYPYGGVPIFQDLFGIDFSLNLAKNRGGAWGILSSFPLFLAVLRLSILTFLFIYLIRKMRDSSSSVWTILPLLLIFIGAAGNILDFFIYGAVIDLFHFVLWGYSFPIFNIADMLILFGASALLVASFLKQREKRCR